jgi:uncharacterized protein YbjT (DUF2867 family)
MRRPQSFQGRIASETELVAGDVLDTESLERAMQGVHTAYYLVHSMGSAQGFEETDRVAAERFGAAARKCKVRKVIYLGGLGDRSGSLSRHLRSRQEVGKILRESGVPAIEFRASIVLGSGSLSFEMIRALVERLPVMITPRWVTVRAQPIAIRDVIQYLLEGFCLELGGSQVFEIGGPDQVSYGDLMREYGRQRGLRRLMIPVPVLTPRLSGLWLGLVTPVYARVGRKLVDSIRNPTLVQDRTALKMFACRPISVRDAIAEALREEDRYFAEAAWAEALSSSATVRSCGGLRIGNRLIYSQAIRVAAPPATAFKPIGQIGGKTGWYYGDWLWEIRGWMDRLIGGVGMRRGRPESDELKSGDTVDCWRVESIEPDRRLRLSAEMKLPGRAWLELEVIGDASGSTIRQTSVFDPVGLRGLIYWYLVHAVHRALFAGMLRGIARTLESPLERK